MIGALENLLSLLKNDPRHVEAHYNLANLYYDAGDFPAGGLHYEAAAQIEPNFSLVYYNLALVYHRLKMSLPRRIMNKYKELDRVMKRLIGRSAFESNWARPPRQLIPLNLHSRTIAIAILNRGRRILVKARNRRPATRK